MKYQNIPLNLSECTPAPNIALSPNHQFTENSQTPQFDPNMVRAMAIEESDIGKTGPNGTGVNDPIMANYPGDWNSSSDVKTEADMTQLQTMTPNTSIQGGMHVLLIKGMRSDGNYIIWRGNEAALNRYGPGNSAYGTRIIANQTA